MAKYASQTQVPVERSRAEIERTLVRYGAEIRFHRHGCWEWIGRTNNMGYGWASTGKRTGRLAHRLIYEAFVGPIPDGLDLDHLCRNRNCVRPSHLEAVPRRENLLRGEGRTMRAHLANTCVHGHAMDAANTYISPKGQRHCQACRRRREAERLERRRLADIRS